MPILSLMFFICILPMHAAFARVSDSYTSPKAPALVNRPALALFCLRATRIITLAIVLLLSL